MFFIKPKLKIHSKRFEKNTSIANLPEATIKKEMRSLSDNASPPYYGARQPEKVRRERAEGNASDEGAATL
jgi:hypothetical protein